jgi:hypothetical protein
VNVVFQGVEELVINKIELISIYTSYLGSKDRRTTIQG